IGLRIEKKRCKFILRNRSSLLHRPASVVILFGMSGFRKSAANCDFLCLSLVLCQPVSSPHRRAWQARKLGPHRFYVGQIHGVAQGTFALPKLRATDLRKAGRWLSCRASRAAKTLLANHSIELFI